MVVTEEELLTPNNDFAYVIGGIGVAFVALGLILKNGTIALSLGVICIAVAGIMQRRNNA